MKITLTFPGEPKAIQSCRFVNMGKFTKAYQPKKNTDWKAYIRVSAQEQLQKLFPDGFKPLDTAIIIRKAYFIFTPIKSLKKIIRRDIERGLNIYKTTKPDLTDNLFKGVIDALSGILYRDDSLICRVENSAKFYGAKPRIELEFEFEFEENKTELEKLF